MKKGLISFVIVLFILIVISFFTRRFTQDAKTQQESQSVSVWKTPEELPQQTEKEPEKKLEYTAMWISYLEWESVDFSSQDNFTLAISEMITNSASLGVDRIIVQVRPFGDALYQSEIFPASHLITGKQGDVLTYDPLQIMVTGAHAAGLKIEAWVNPYRIQLNTEKPAELADNNPAVQWAAREETVSYVKQAAGGLYYNPGEPKVQQMIVDGIKEIIANYAVDGIVFDDYFYPSTEPEFDEDTYEKYGGELSLEEWRRQNVNSLVQLVYAAIKKQNPECSFGISPSGNIMNNMTQQYSDVVTWLSQSGYVDYLAPQLYWGFDYRTKSGSEAYAFENVLEEWLNLPRLDGVKLYPVLAAYRIGEGDGSSVQSTEWETGDNLARMVEYLQEKTAGFSLYRYDFLYRNTKYESLATKELAALQLILARTEHTVE